MWRKNKGWARLCELGDAQRQVQDAWGKKHWASDQGGHRANTAGKLAARPVLCKGERGTPFGTPTDTDKQGSAGQSQRRNS